MKPTNKTLKGRYESYLVTLEKQRDQLYKLIRSARDDRNADLDEIDRYLDLLNDVNRMLDKLNEKP